MLFESPILNNQELVFNLCLLTKKILNDDEVYFSFGNLNDEDYGQYKINTLNEKVIETHIDFLDKEQWNYFYKYPLVISNSKIDWLVYESDPAFNGLIAFKNQDICSMFLSYLDEGDFLTIDEAKKMPTEALDAYPDIRPFITNYSRN